MTDKLLVKEHLRNEALYRPLSEPSLNEEWKRRLFYQHALNEQLKAALWERPLLLRQFIRIGVPIICIVLVFTSYFRFIDPERWFEYIVPRLSFFENTVPVTRFIENIVPRLSLDLPPIGLMEVLVFVAIVNALTFTIRKRLFAL
jgi:hypothetical protein